MRYAGRMLMTLVSAWAAFGSYFFDWNETHIFNPRWPPHARFHNAQTMLLGTCLGLLAMLLLWSSRVASRERLYLAATLASLYWVTQAAAIFFPGTALVDPEFAYPGQPPVQLIVDAVMLVLLGTGLVAARSDPYLRDLPVPTNRQGYPGAE